MLLLSRSSSHCMGRLSKAMLAEAKIVAEAEEIWACERLSEDVSDVVARPDLCNSQLAICNELANGVILHTNVFDLRVPHVVLR